MNQDTILQRASQVTFEVVAGEAILIDMQSGTYFSLDEVGTLFWEMLDGLQTLAELAEHIVRHYNEKSERYVTELSQLGQTAVENGSAIPAHAVETLAVAFGLEEDEVREHEQRLAQGTVAEMAPQLVAEFVIDSEMVLNDLVDLATTMLGDDLLVSLK